MRSASSRNEGGNMDSDLSLDLGPFFFFFLHFPHFPMQNCEKTA